MGTRRRRTRRRALGLVAACLALATVAALTPVGRSLAVRVAGLEQDGGLVNALTPLPRGSGAALNVLVVGNDSRERIRRDAGDRFGRTDTLSGERADAIMLVRLVSGSGRVQVLSVPRDLQVEVDGFGPQKLSLVLELGGRPLLIRTVRTSIGLPVHHNVELDFVGFAEAVDRLGGVTLEFDKAGRDLGTGFEADAGLQHLDGTAALAYVRARHFEELVDGQWVPLNDGDKGRIVRQQEILGAMARQTGQESRLSLLRHLRALGSHVTVDGRFSPSQMVSLTRQLADTTVVGSDIRTLPTEPVPDSQRLSPFPPEHLGAVHHETLVQPGATAVVRDFGGGEVLR